MRVLPSDFCARCAPWGRSDPGYLCVPRLAYVGSCCAGCLLILAVYNSHSRGGACQAGLHHSACVAGVLVQCAHVCVPCVHEGQGHGPSL